MVQMDIAVTLSPAVQMFWDIRRVYESDGHFVPELIENGWAKLMRVRDYAELDLESWSRP